MKTTPRSYLRLRLLLDALAIAAPRGVVRADPPTPEMHIEGGPFDGAGLVGFILDGTYRDGGPAATGRSGAVETIVLEPDDITLGLSGQI